MTMKIETAQLVTLAIFALGGIGYLLKRYIEGKRETELVDNAHKWAKLYREVHDHAPTVDDILRIKATFMQKKGVANDASEDTKAIEVSAKEAPEWMFFGYDLTDWEREQAKNGKGIYTQLELNERASKSAMLIDGELSKTSVQLCGILLENELNHFNSAMRDWEAFRVSQSTYAASQYEGGTIAPMVYWSEYFGITKTKIESLRSDLSFRKQTTERENAVFAEVASSLDSGSRH